jgi:hypothetical protein
MHLNLSRNARGRDFKNYYLINKPQNFPRKLICHIIDYCSCFDKSDVYTQILVGAKKPEISLRGEQFTQHIYY